MKNTIKFALRSMAIIALIAVIVFSMAACKKGANAAAAAAASAVTAVTGTASSSATQITSWDSFLNDYENFVMNEYVPLINKMKAGDLTVLADLEPLTNKFTEWARQIQTLAVTAGEPTEEQARKIGELTQRVDAALE